MTGMVRDMKPDAARMKKAAGEGYATATDLADWLVRTLNMPFREAHHVTGKIVAAAAQAGRRAAPAAARDHAEDRAADHRGGVRRALGRPLGQEPHELWRHGARRTCGAGQEVVENSSKKSRE